MKYIFRLLVVSTFLHFSFVTASALTPAFPGAEGGGMYTTGGRGGTVYYVNTLSDNSTGSTTTREGSLRWCLSQSGKRTILFKVSGLITLNSQLSISNGDVTIAGQTAPGDGICIRNYTTYVGSKNVIIRFMRFRLGDEALQESDAIWGRNSSDIIIDHCSMSWCVDECASFYSNKNFTLQWCLLAESLRNSVHGKGAHGFGGIWGGENATYHHNMLAHHDSRNPRFNGWKRSGLNYGSTIAEERLDFRNNVVYNWGSKSNYGGESAGQYNMVNNYFKYGPATASSARSKFAQADIDAGTTIILPRHGKYFLSGNYIFGYPAITNDNTQGITNKTGFSLETIIANVPYACNPVTTHSAVKAYEKVLAYVGCSIKRDTVDGRLVQEAKTGTFTFTGSNGSNNGLIDTQSDVGGWPSYNSSAAPIDTDIDGMPDVWETTNGLNPNNATDGNTFTLSTEGYTNLEVYLNSLVSSITLNQNAEGSYTTAIKEQKLDDQTLKVLYQNGNWNIQSDLALKCFDVYDMTGRIVLNQDLGCVSNWSGSTEKLSSGLYFLKPNFADAKRVTMKLMVTN